MKWYTRFKEIKLKIFFLTVHSGPKGVKNDFQFFAFSNTPNISERSGHFSPPNRGR